MKKEAFSYLKKIPWLYNMLHFLYWRLVSLKALFSGTKLEERKWANKGSKEVAFAFTNLNHPHRDFLAKEISSLYPFSDVLEVGCGYGPNLYSLAKKFPQTNFTGIDINALSIEEGSKWLKKEGAGNVKLIHSKADGLSSFADKSFDIIFTDALLMYIGPDKIKNTIREMKRISRKALVFLEQGDPSDSKDPEGLGYYNSGQWQRNYPDLLKQFFPADHIQSSMLPEGVWPGDDWSKLGVLIKVLI